MLRDRLVGLTTSWRAVLGRSPSRFPGGDRRPARPAMNQAGACHLLPSRAFSGWRAGDCGVGAEAGVDGVADLPLEAAEGIFMGFGVFALFWTPDLGFQ